MAIEPKITAWKGIHCRIVTETDELVSLANKWERLWELDPAREIFQNPGWVRAWMRAFGKDHALCTPIVYDGDELVLILPLVLRNRELRFLGYSVSDYNTAVGSAGIGPEALIAALEALFTSPSMSWDRVVLENVREDSALVRAIRQLPPRWHQVTQVSGPTPCPVLLLGDSRQEVLSEILSRSKVKKTWKTIRRLGTLNFRYLESASELRDHLRRFAGQHIARCALDGRRSQFLSENYTAFCEYLLEGIKPARQVRFSVLEISGRPVAYHLGFEVNGKYLFYKPTFDIEFWDYSPGQVLLFHLFEGFRCSDVREFDFGQGGEPYKYRYSNSSRNNLTLTIYAPGVRGQLRRICGQAAVAGRVQARAAIERWVRLPAVQSRIEETMMRRRDRRVIRRLTLSSSTCGMVYALPEVKPPVRDFQLRPVTLSELAQRAAQHPEFLTAHTLHLIRELLKKSHSIYADDTWTNLVLASQGRSVTTAAGSIDLGAPALVFTVIIQTAAERQPLFDSMAQVAAARGLTGLLISDRPEPFLRLHGAFESNGNQ